MGAGKTTVGKLLARRLGWKFVDLDDVIVAREGRSIADLFRDSGESYFRRVETECLRTTLESQVSGVSAKASGAVPVPPTPDTLTPDTSTRDTSTPDTLPSDTRSFVLALGGGAIVQAVNAEIVAQSRIPVFFLDASPDELRRRCSPQVGVRPLFTDENQFRQLYESRQGSYMSAGVRIDTASLSPEQVADEIVRRLDPRIQE